MKELLTVIIALLTFNAASAAQAQVVADWYPAPPVVAPPVIVTPPVPVVGYYAAPVVRFTPGRYFGPMPVAPLPRRYGYRERVYVRGPYYRGTLRVRGW